MSGRHEPLQADRRPPHTAPLRLRLVVGLGDPHHEGTLLPALHAGDDFSIERCLTAEQLRDRVRRGRVDAVLVAGDLPGLGRGALADLARSRAPLVVLAADPESPQWAA